MGFITDQLTNSAMSLATSGASSFLGGQLDSYFSDRRLTNNANTMIKQYGLTPQEAFGSPAAGGTATNAATQSLTNSTAERDIAKMQNAQQLARDKLQSDTQLATAHIAADAHIKSSQLQAGATAENVGLQTSSQIKAAEIAASAHRYQADSTKQSAMASLAQTADLTKAQTANISTQTAKALQEITQSGITHSERWEKLFSTMSAENVLASVYAVKSGIDIKKVLTGAPNQSRADLDMFIKLATSSGSVVQRETMGAQNVLRSANLSRPITDIQQIIKAMQYTDDAFGRKAEYYRQKQEAERDSQGSR